MTNKIKLFYHGFRPNMVCLVRMDGNFKVLHFSISGQICLTFLRYQQNTYSH